MSEKEKRIFEAIMTRAKEVIKFGRMPVMFDIQNGNIVFGEFQPGHETIKIG